MPLPFLRPKRVAGVIIAHRKPDGSQETRGMEGDEDQGLMSAAEDLIRCVHAKDAAGVAQAWRAGFQILDSEPHEEGEHTNEEEPDMEGQE